MVQRMSIFSTAAVLLLVGCGPEKPQSQVQRGLEEYARVARNLKIEDGVDDGSVWTDNAGWGDAFRDVKARRLGDLVTVQVVEATSAIQEATTESSRASEVSYNVNNLAGAEKKVAELPNLISADRSSTFTGDAATSRRSTVSTSLTARVVEVFPNRNLLIEANREVLVNGERQLVTLRGVVRPTDISADNVVLSTRIAEMELEVDGRGLVADAQKPGWLFKVLNGIWPF